MQTQFTYFLILALSLAGPLLLSFDRKVAFYRKWRPLFGAMLLPAILYIIWDMYFTKQGVWQFNSAYITGIKLGNLPVEEVLFFFVVPYCCVFIYECIRCYFPAMNDHKAAAYLLQALVIALLAIGFYFYFRAYTSWTFIALAIFIQLILFFRKNFAFLHLSAFLVSYLIILIPFLLVNGFLTALPVVIYNDMENLGIRIYTIPFEDVFYGMLLILMNITGFEYLRNRQQLKSR